MKRRRDEGRLPSLWSIEPELMIRYQLELAGTSRFWRPNFKTIYAEETWLKDSKKNRETVSKTWEVLKSGLAGGIAGCVAKTVISPLDRVKILFQTGQTRYLSYSGTLSGVFGAMGAIWKDSGVRGLVQGHSATLLRIFPYAGIKFMAYDTFHGILMSNPNQETSARRFLAGALSGVTAVCVTYPLDVIRVRLAIENRKVGDRSIRLIETIIKIYNEKAWVEVQSNQNRKLFERFPIAKFYRGFTPTLCGMIPYAGTSFLIWGTLQSRVRAHLKETEGSTLSVLLNLLSGSLAGLISQTASYPLEIIRRKMQVGGLDKHRTMFETSRDIYRSSGPRGFFIGLSIGYLKVIPMTAISYFTWSTLKIKFE